MKPFLSPTEEEIETALSKQHRAMNAGKELGHVSPKHMARLKTEAEAETDYEDALEIHKRNELYAQRGW